MGLILPQVCEITICPTNRKYYEDLGYFIEPKYLFTSCINLIEQEKFDVDYLNKAINSITASTLGKKSEKLFENLFDDMDLTSSKLGRDVKSRSILIAKVMKSIDTIDFELENTEIDVLGDAYEYLIGMYILYSSICFKITFFTCNRRT